MRVAEAAESRFADALGVVALLGAVAVVGVLGTGGARAPGPPADGRLASDFVDADVLSCGGFGAVPAVDAFGVAVLTGAGFAAALTGVLAGTVTLGTGGGLLAAVPVLAGAVEPVDARADLGVVAEALLVVEGAVDAADVRLVVDAGLPPTEGASDDAIECALERVLVVDSVLDRAAAVVVAKAEPPAVDVVLLAVDTVRGLAAVAGLDAPSVLSTARGLVVVAGLEAPSVLRTGGLAVPLTGLAVLAADELDATPAGAFGAAGALEAVAGDFVDVRVVVAVRDVAVDRALATDRTEVRED